jgi:hypothetical protein
VKRRFIGLLVASSLPMTRTSTSTEKQTQAPVSPPMTYTQSYTADGDPLLRTDGENQQVLSTRTTTITSTAQVCK